MVFTCFLISKSYSFFTNPLGIVTSPPITIGITVTFMLHFFLVLQLGQDVYISFRFFLIFTLWSAGTTKCTIRQVFFCWLSLDLVVWPRLGDLFVSQNPRDVHLIFCVVHIPLVRLVKFNFLSQFPMNHFPHPVVSSIILFLC